MNAPTSEPTNVTPETLEVVAAALCRQANRVSEQIAAGEEIAESLAELERLAEEGGLLWGVVSKTPLASRIRPGLTAALAAIRDAERAARASLDQTTRELDSFLLGSKCNRAYRSANRP